MTDLVHISAGSALVTAFLGYLVVFFGLVLLMGVLMIMGKAMHRETPKAISTPAPTTELSASAPKSETAPGTAGELKLYETDPREAAMIMAIVADTLGKPINELRFISIKEVKNDEV